MPQVSFALWWAGNVYRRITKNVFIVRYSRWVIYYSQTMLHAFHVSVVWTVCCIQEPTMYFLILKWNRPPGLHETFKLLMELSYKGV